MNLNFTVSLTDIGVGLDVSGNNESECQEVMDFLVSVDESMADSAFSQELIYRLAENFTHETEGYRHLTVEISLKGVPELVKPVDTLAEDLSELSEEHLIVLMADAIFRKRERDTEAPEKEDPPCTRCGCPRAKHKVRVEEDASGCSDHISCDEWRQDKPGTKSGSVVDWLEHVEGKQDKPLPLSAVCVCGHNLNWHNSLERLNACALTSIKDLMGSIPCPCKGFEEKA